MPGKFTTVLTKKEAEAYQSQGLHKEALNLYRSLLSSLPNISPEIKTAIQSQIQGIATEIEGPISEEHQRLTAQDIARIREGWGENASESDLLVCAQAFYQVGHYADALAEYKKLLKRGTAARTVASAVTDCLVRLYPPDALPQGSDQFAAEIFEEQKKALAFQLLLAKQMAAGDFTEHALAFYHHLNRNACLSPQIQEDIVALEKRSQHKPAPFVSPDAHQGTETASSPGTIQRSRLRSLLGTIGRKLRFIPKRS